MFDFRIANRSYANNKSVNKIVIEVNGESSKLNFEAYRRVYFDPSKSYILSGKTFINNFNRLTIELSTVVFKP